MSILGRLRVLRLILLRTVVGLLTLWAASLVVFLGTQLLPGDAAQAALGQTATATRRGTPQGSWAQSSGARARYWEWLGGFVRGDFGLSLPRKNRWRTSSETASSTGMLALLTVAVLIPLSLFLGILSAVRRDRPFDHWVTGISLALISTPEFVVGSLLALLLAVKFGWFPPPL